MKKAKKKKKIKKTKEDETNTAPIKKQHIL